MKKIFVLFLFVYFVKSLAFAQATVNTEQSLVVPQNVTFENCTKIFNVNEEKLFYLTLASISANRFLVE